MKQAGRELTNFDDGFLNGKFCPAFREILEAEGVEPLRLRLEVPT